MTCGRHGLAAPDRATRRLAEATLAMECDAVRIQVCREALLALCRRHHIRRLSLFGSVRRDDFGPDSDMDVLVEFEVGHTPGWEIVDIQDELSGLFGGRKVDIGNPKYLKHSIKDRVLAEAVVLYEASNGA